MQIQLDSLFSWGSFRNLIDILIVWYILYNILVIIKGTRAINLIEGNCVIAEIKFPVSSLGLNNLDWIMNFVIQWGVVAALIVFQPEIRRVRAYRSLNFFSRKYESANEAEIMISGIEYSDSIYGETSYRSVDFYRTRQLIGRVYQYRDS